MAGRARHDLVASTRETITRGASPPRVQPVSEPQRTLASVVGNRAFTNLIARQMGEVRVAEHKQEVLQRLKLNYARAESQNKRYAKATTERTPDSLGWETKLAAAAGGAELLALWKAGRYAEFADAVAARQLDLGFRESEIDGILGPGTWSRIAGLGEAMADIDETVFQASETLCYKATEERMKRGFRRATGEAFKLPEGAQESTFAAIIASFPDRMLDVDERYRGTGAAGALVYSGLGAFVSEDDIWAGKLAPGATLQVWRHKGAYDLLRKGEVTEKGKTRRITDSDANYFGTSYVFVRYDTQSNERVLVRHFGGLEWVGKGDWAVWVAANPTPALR
jgi:hypothetical protein